MKDAAGGRSWAGAPGWMKALIALSLLINFTIAGLAVGVAGRLKDQREAAGGAYTIRHVLKAIPEDRREAAKARIEAVRKDLRRVRDARRDARRAVIEATGAAEFDPEALSAAFATLRARDTALRALTQSLMVETLAMLTDQERADLAEHLRQTRYGRQRPRDGAAAKP